MGIQLNPAFPRVVDVLHVFPCEHFTRPHTSIGLHHIAPLLRGQCVPVAPPVVAPLVVVDDEVDDVVAILAAPTYPAIPQANFTRAIAECLDVVAGDPVVQQRDNISISSQSSPISILISHGHLPCRCCHLPYRYCVLRLVCILVCHLNKMTTPYLATFQGGTRSRIIFLDCC